MNEFNSYSEIARLIKADISGELNSTDSQMLNVWIEASAENRSLYFRIKNSANFAEWNNSIKNIDVETQWGKILPIIKRNKKIYLYRKILGYAAAMILPVLLAGGIYWYSNDLSKGEGLASVPANQIRPGSQKAILTLNNGESIVLDSATNKVIQEKDGTLIERGNGKLNYTKSSKGETLHPIFNILRIPRGGEFTLLLSDGSRVHLNAMSNFKYPVRFGGNKREVELSGEAFFEVTKDKSRPFVIRTARMSVEVLGTTFNLNAYENNEKIVTTLVEGSVRINSPITHESRLLSPDEQATFNVSNGQTEIKKVDVNLYTAWKDGNLIFYDARLEDIMTTLSRWYSANVLYRSSSVKDLRFSGNLNRYGDINQILDIISSTGKINIEIDKNTILFSKK